MRSNFFYWSNSLGQTSFYAPIQAELVVVDQLMRSQAQDYHPDLQKALDIILSSGGKRVRAAITLLVGKMLGADPQALILLAGAIEMLHTATLVHDDLIDGALLRRGTPTLNSQWSPGATVLTGDFLFARAAKMAADTKNVEVIRLFAETLGVIVNGEITQLFSKHFLADREIYYKRIYAKTASLFETCTRSAAMLSHANPDVVEDLSKFGHAIGMSFQIIDDFLDFNGEQVTLGKPVGNDLRQGLITLPTVYYLETHSTDPNAIALLKEKYLEDERQTKELIQAIIQSDSTQRAHQEAVDFVENGIVYLKKQPGNLYRDSLEEIARYFVTRNV
jgi:geranylgeranyl pyrophosphate synthase